MQRQFAKCVYSRERNMHGVCVARRRAASRCACGAAPAWSRSRRSGSRSRSLTSMTTQCPLCHDGAVHADSARSLCVSFAPSRASARSCRLRRRARRALGGGALAAAALARLPLRRRLLLPRPRIDLAHAVPRRHTLQRHRPRHRCQLRPSRGRRVGAHRLAVPRGVPRLWVQMPGAQR